MKTNYLNRVLLLATVGLCLVGTSQSNADDRAGNGAMYYSLEGFDNYAAQSKKMRDAISDALRLVRGLGLDTNTNLPELNRVPEEIQTSNYILVNQDVQARPNGAPGDYAVGGYLVASTDPYRGAPTRIYPRFLSQLSNTQMQQAIIHEAHHRALPEPMNTYEAIVVRLTSIETQYSAASVASTLRSYLDEVRAKKLPWIAFVAGRCGHVCQKLTPEEQEIMQPLYDDNSLVNSTVNNTRIAINVIAIGDYSRVDVYDRYRELVYSFVKQSETPLMRAEATQFIRATLKKIEDDLKWQ